MTFRRATLTRGLIVRAVIIAAVVAACGGEGSPAGRPTPRESPSPQPTQTPVPKPRLPASPPPTFGARSSDCVNGWSTPLQTHPLWPKPLRLIRRVMGVGGGFVVVDMRYFQGPESPPSIKGYLAVIDRWYVKGFLRSDPAIQGRWLVEEREFGSGVVAVAPYESVGFGSPDWVGFQYRAAEPDPRPRPGLPGEWSGVAYDFVKGGEGLDMPGLPAKVAGCLAGT